MNFDQMELEKQGKMDTIPFHFAAQETDPQQLDTWINPYRSFLTIIYIYIYSSFSF